MKLVETVDVVGALPTEMAGLTPELDGLRKANALFNQGLISMDEIDEYADTLAAAKRKEVAEKERDAREAAEREARARADARPPARRRAPSAASWASWPRRGNQIVAPRPPINAQVAGRARGAAGAAAGVAVEGAKGAACRATGAVEASRPGPSPPARASRT